MRDPANWSDAEALAELTHTAPVSEESVMLLLAHAEHVVVAAGYAVPFLERIQQEYPDDFWSNSTLGIRLTETSDEAPIRYFQAAVAVRPDDCFARTNLGSALGASGRTEEHLGGVDQDVATVAHLDAEPVHPAGRRTELVLAGGVVLRAVTGALEPL